MSHGPARNVPLRDTRVTQRRALLASLGALGLGRALPARADSGRGWRPLAPGLWWLPAAEGDGGAADRGQVSQLLLATAGGRLWLLGSGPSPAFGLRLAGTLQARWPGRPLTVVSPWPRPELVLGVAGLEARWVDAVVHVAHAEVAAQMAQRCPGCVERLRARLGAAAEDLDPGDPVRLPASLLQGERGGLGPWRWWRLARADDVTVTVWQHAASGWAFAPGLLWGRAAPDGRDADIARLAQATAALPGLPGLARPAGWIGEQGGPQEAGAAAAAAGYWAALQAAVATALERGDSGEAAPAALPGVAASFTAEPRHALNWQRAWRQAEERWLQRSLR